MFRFLHTGDWQIGMRASGLGVAGEKVRLARLDALRNVFAAARDRGVQAVLVAGDLFEDNQVGGVAVAQVVSILNDADACPVYLLPGNHDPFTPASIWTRPAFALRPHVRPLTTAEPVELAPGVTLFPCPLTAKNGTGDPTRIIPPRPPGDAALRVGLAHGTLPLQPDMGRDDFPIALDAVTRCGLEYLAIGHWHSTLSDPSGRAWYSGTHETTKFGERDSGNALCVTLTEAGAPPTVEPVRTGTLTWTERTIDLDVEPAEAVLRSLAEAPDAARTLARLRLTGPLTPDTTAAVARMRDVLAARFLHGDVDERGLRPGSAAEALADLAGSPYLLAAADELKALPTPEAARALELLHACAWAARAGR